MGSAVEKKVVLDRLARLQRIFDYIVCIQIFLLQSGLIDCEIMGRIYSEDTKKEAVVKDREVVKDEEVEGDLGKERRLVSRWTRGSGVWLEASNIIASTGFTMKTAVKTFENHQKLSDLDRALQESREELENMPPWQRHTTWGIQRFERYESLKTQRVSLALESVQGISKSTELNLNLDVSRLVAKDVENITRLMKAEDKEREKWWEKEGRKEKSTSNRGSKSAGKKA